MLSSELEISINTLFRDARDNHHEFVTVEHLLLAMTKNDSATEALKACGIEINALQVELEDFIDNSTPILHDEDERETQPTLGFQRVIQRSVYHVQASGKEEVIGENILVAIFGEPESHAVYFLNKQDMSRLDLVNYVSHGVHKYEDEPSLSDLLGDEGGTLEGEADDDAVSENPLEKYADNLNQKARDGKIDPLIGRDEEVERTVQVLCRRRKNNPAN